MKLFHHLDKIAKVFGCIIGGNFIEMIVGKKMQEPIEVVTMSGPERAFTSSGGAVPLLSAVVSLEFL